MKVLGTRRGGVATLVVAVVALVVAAGFAVWQIADRPSVESPVPAPGSAVATPRPVIAFGVPDEARLGGLRVTVDGKDATASARAADGRVTVAAPRLKDGDHAVEVRFTSSNVFARTVTRRWTFAVDTAPPPLKVASPASGRLSARKAVRFTGTAEPGARVAVASGDRVASGVADSEGGWVVVARLPEGRSAARVTAIDAAGNATTRARRLVVDTTAPQIALAEPAAGSRLTETDAPLVYGTSGDDPAQRLTYTATVNGRVAVTVKGSDGITPADAAASYGAAAATTPPLQVDGRRFALGVGTLAQGRNRLSVTARDRAGNRAKVTTTVTVDTTEEFGEADLGPGSRGADVTALQKRLRAVKVYPKKAKLTGVLDATTEKSVVRYQKRFDLPQSGVVDARTRTAMIGRIVVNIGQRKLRLIRDGRVFKTYRIAVGQPAYPTPTGEYTVNDKQVDPYWYPPDSPWAAELSTIPPGPGNPLGTRWIGTTAPAIGIHGTYADSSIGTAASHGCMRMHIPDVEELFEEVAVGMPVSIRA